MTCWITNCPADPVVQWRRREAESDDVTAVLACGQHAIGLDSAAHIHQPTCRPTPALLPTCGCVPEPLPKDPDPPRPATLPTGWVVDSERPGTGSDG